MTKRIKKLYSLLARYGNQTNIYGYSVFDIRALIETYIEEESDVYQHQLEFASSNLKLDVARCVYYLQGRISIETLEYRLFNVKPEKSFETEGDLSDLDLYDLLNTPKRTCTTCKILMFKRDGIAVEGMFTQSEVKKQFGIDPTRIKQVIGTYITASGYHFRYTTKEV